MIDDEDAAGDQPAGSAADDPTAPARPPRFAARDYAFAAVVTAALLVANGIAVPLTLGIRIPGIRNLVSAPLACLLLAFALVRLRRRGAVLLVHAPLAIIYLAIHPVIAGFVLAGAAFTEVACGLPCRGYRSPAAWLLAPLVYQLASFAVGMALAAAFLPEQLYREAAWWLWTLMIIALAVASLAFAWLGVRLARELGRAGRLRVAAGEEDPG